MIRIIRSDDRYHFVNTWLSAYWHFSFDQYYDPGNTEFGPLRVFNDDTVKPGAGFPMHGHRNMEILTYVLEGTVEHRDNTGNAGRLGSGEVQRMTAGWGIRHSEYNPSPDQFLHLLQIWFVPETANLPPSYEQRQFTPDQRLGRLLPIASGPRRNGSNAVKLNQDVTVYVSTLRAEDQITHSLEVNRRAYVFVIDGGLSLNGQRMESGDQARVEAENKLVLSATEHADVMLIDLP